MLNLSLEFGKNKTLDYLEKQKLLQQQKLDHFKASLSVCGHYVTHNYHCRQCEEEGRGNSLLAFKREIHTCGIRFCSKPDCITTRFADTYNAISQVKRFEGLRVLHHFSIGFEKITEEDFKNNFDKIKKQHERVLNSFLTKLRKAEINIQAYRVLDISKGKRQEVWDRKYYIHYHFIALPFKHADSRTNLAKIQFIRKQMLSRQRKRMPFHFQSFGLKKKEALYSYLALRSIGLYKKFEAREKDYNIYEARNLRNSLEEGKFMPLNELVDEEHYLKYFFGRRHLNSVGGLPLIRYGSNTADNLAFITCKYHGTFFSNDISKVRHEFIIDLKPPDPPPLGSGVKNGKVYLVYALQFQKINADGYNPYCKSKIYPTFPEIRNWEDIEKENERKRKIILPSGISSYEFEKQHEKQQKRIMEL